MIRRRGMRSGRGGLCIVLGLLLVAACATDDRDSARSAPGDADATEVVVIDPIGASSPPDDPIVLEDVEAGSRPVVIGADDLVVDDVASGRPSLACTTGRTIDAGVHTSVWHEVDRQVIVRLPETSLSAPPPVVFSLHGSAASAATHEAWLQFSTPAAARGYVVLTPEGMPPDEGGIQVWELFPGIYPDDPGYLASLVDWVGDAMCVDLDRVYATGFSNGSTMTNVLACHTGGRFRAIGAVGAHRFPIICPSGPVSVIGIHGTADSIVPYLGGPLLRRPEIWMPPVEETFASWADVGGCDIAPRYEVVATDVVRRRWARCEEGIQVELYTIEGGGHAWPMVDDPLYPGKIDATTLILDFFDAN